LLLRRGSFQGGPWSGLDRKAPDRDDFARLRPTVEGMSRAPAPIRNVITNSLVQYSQSLFQCKQLKRAALGRKYYEELFLSKDLTDSSLGMATLIKRLKDPLLYLDQVRQHLARLPDINPTTRTMLVAGFPNVGKSSFVSSVTRADTPVEPYAFVSPSVEYNDEQALMQTRQRRVCLLVILTTNVSS